MMTWKSKVCWPKKLINFSFQRRGEALYTSNKLNWAFQSNPNLFKCQKLQVLAYMSSKLFTRVMGG